MTVRITQFIEVVKERKLIQQLIRHDLSIIQYCTAAQVT